MGVGSRGLDFGPLVSEIGEEGASSGATQETRKGPKTLGPKL